jgi:protease-4
LLRVDSPGGSVTASETIWREVKRARERGKPVVVSMGAVAASGGYYVSMCADAIVANPGTITGSIGVITGKLVVRDLKERLGVASDTVRTNANADAWSADTLFTPEQQAHREAEADLFYTDFVERVAEGRNLPVEAVNAVARGRVWTGADALERGLVDELGGFRAAVRRAKVLADLDEDADVRLVSYPSSSLLDLVRPRALAARAVAGIVAEAVESVAETLNGAKVLWLGESRF